MKPTALITGASGGIGYELSLLFAKAGYNLIVVARSQDKLEELRHELDGHPVTILPQDLSEPGAAQIVYDKVKELGLNVTVLVNNAGFGLNGLFEDLPLLDQQKMLQVNVNALTELTHLFLPEIKAARFRFDSEGCPEYRQHRCLPAGTENGRLLCVQSLRPVLFGSPCGRTEGHPCHRFDALPWRYRNQLLQNSAGGAYEAGQTDDDTGSGSQIRICRFCQRPPCHHSGTGQPDDGLCFKTASPLMGCQSRSLHGSIILMSRTFLPETNCFILGLLEENS